jgi:hypothetical protein
MNGRASAMVVLVATTEVSSRSPTGSSPAHRIQTMKYRGSRNIGGRLRIRRFTSTTTSGHLELPRLRCRG